MVKQHGFIVSYVVVNDLPERHPRSNRLPLLARRPACPTRQHIEKGIRSLIGCTHFTVNEMTLERRSHSSSTQSIVSTFRGQISEYDSSIQPDTAVLPNELKPSVLECLYQAFLSCCWSSRPLLAMVTRRAEQWQQQCFCKEAAGFRFPKDVMSNIAEGVAMMHVAYGKATGLALVSCEDDL